MVYNVCLSVNKSFQYNKTAKWTAYIHLDPDVAGELTVCGRGRKLPILSMQPMPSFRPYIEDKALIGDSRLNDPFLVGFRYDSIVGDGVGGMGGSTSRDITLSLSSDHPLSSPSITSSMYDPCCKCIERFDS